DDGQKTYGLKGDVDTRPEDAAPKPVVPAVPGRRKGKRLSKITNVKQWRKVGLGMQLIAAGLLVWLAGYLLYRVPLVLGLALGEEYAAQADVDRLVTSPPDYGKPAEVNYTTYAITLISGNFWGGFMVWPVRFSPVWFLLMYMPLIAGYAVCSGVPPRSG